MSGDWLPLPRADQQDVEEHDRFRALSRILEKIIVGGPPSIQHRIMNSNVEATDEAYRLCRWLKVRRGCVATDQISEQA